MYTCVRHLLSNEISSNKFFRKDTNCAKFCSYIDHLKIPFNPHNYLTKVIERKLYIIKRGIPATCCLSGDLCTCMLINLRMIYHGNIIKLSLL